MTYTKPPAIAKWFLERFDVQESVVGDLVERYSSKRSSVWFWRQVLMAVWVGIGRDVRAHKFLAIRAVGTGFAVFLVFGYFTRSFLNSFHGSLWINGHWFQPGQWPVPFFYLWIFFGGAVSGWIVGHLHPTHQASMTVVFAGCILILELVQLCVFLTIAPLPIWFQIGDFGLVTPTLLVSILLGGLWVPLVIPDSPEAARSRR